MKAPKTPKPRRSTSGRSDKHLPATPSRSDIHLADLVAPLRLPQLVNEYLDRRPLYIKANEAKQQLAARLFNAELLRNALARGHALRAAEPYDAFSLRAIFPPDHEGPVEIPITPVQVDTLLAAGASICAHDIHLGDEALAAFVSSAKHALGFAGRMGMSCYVSPKGRGLTTHFDAQSVMTLQIEGKKRWRYSEKPALAVPRANAVLEANGKVEWSAVSPGDIPFPEISAPTEAMQEVELEPGDLLYLPAGHWHETLAGEPSIGLVLYFVPMSFSTFLERWLWSCFEENDAWIKGPPAAAAAEGEAMTRLPDPILAYISERLAELQTMLQTADPSALSLLRTWRKFVAQGSPAHRATHTPPVRRDDAFVVKNPSLLAILDARHDASDGGFYLCQGDREIELPSAFAPLVDAMLLRRPFRADSLRPLSLRAARDAIEVLLAEGVLSRVDPQ